MAMSPQIESWFAGLTADQRALATELRELALSEGDLVEEIKWGRPCYSGRSLVCYLQAAKGHVALGFGRGADLPDPSKLLQGSGSQMRHVKLPLGSAFDPEGLRGLLAAAIALDAE